jgi:hypothetical protein
MQAECLLADVQRATLLLHETTQYWKDYYVCCILLVRGRSFFIDIRISYQAFHK